MPATKHIVLTGGGTAGHVTPNLALVPALEADGWTIAYIGSEQGPERKMVQAQGIDYYPIASGKLRRYFSWQNLIDPFLVLKGIIQAYRLLGRLKVQIIFSKGGFVALPVVIAGYLRRLPIVVHESDLSIGLANRLSFPFASKICLSFAGCKTGLKEQDKVVFTGSPIREALFQGDRARGLALCGFDNQKPCLLVMGGGQGSLAINRIIRLSLDQLLAKMNVIHLCGQGKHDSSLDNRTGYCQFDYADKELADLLAASDWVVSRAGANSLCELLALAKPHILIPLPLAGSRGDQIENARYFEKQGISLVIPEQDLTSSSLLIALEQLNLNQERIIQQMHNLAIQSAVQKIIDVLKQTLSKTRQL